LGRMREGNRVPLEGAPSCCTVSFSPLPHTRCLQMQKHISAGDGLIPLPGNSNELYCRLS
jgi:hypothetical protein